MLLHQCIIPNVLHGVYGHNTMVNCPLQLDCNGPNMVPMVLVPVKDQGCRHKLKQNQDLTLTLIVMVY